MKISLTEYHKILLSMLKVIIDLCDSNNLKYYLVGGSALGAVREQGFIAWDEDMDIAFPRKDYERFIELVPQVLEERYAVVYRENACIHHFVDKSQQIDFSQFNPAGFGEISYPFIDLFPIDGAPANGFLRKIRMTKILFYTYLHKFAGISMVVEHPGRSRLQLAVIRTARLLHTDRLFSMETTAKKWIEEAEKSDFASSTWCLIGFGSYKYNDVFPKSWVGKGKIVPFEDIQARIFSNCGDYLQQVYGDYMTPVDYNLTPVKR